MDPLVRLKQIILAAGDIIVFYLALGLTLFVRYGDPFAPKVLEAHLEPFTIILFLWLIVFYISGLYEIRALKTGADFMRRLGTILAINAVIAILFFYFIPAYGITPKTNLFIFLVLIFLLEYWWRNLYNSLLATSLPKIKILLIGDSPAAQEITKTIKENPNLGYEIRHCDDLEKIFQIIIAEKINILAVPAHVKKNSQVARVIYKNLVTGTDIIDVASLYELVMNKLPLSELEEVWFLETLIRRHRVYDFFRRPLEIILALILSIIFLPFTIIIALLIKLTSPGPILIKQKRAGELEQEFTLYKFRSMVVSAEQHGPQWSGEKDKRITPLGKILRRTHLDEIPQLINIIKGDLSFVGPRPERPEFVAQLKNIIPYYELRHLIRPGLTGWAQLNYRYGASVQDAYEKLQYEIYYLKNRSVWLDLSIIIKTIKLFFVKN